MKKTLPTNLARALFRFFQDYLPAQRGMSPHTIHSYRDSVLLLLQYTAKDARRKIEAITFGDFTAERVTRFLRHLETERHNSIATRNARLAGLHTFSRFLIAQYPEHMETFQGVLGIPFKRGTQKLPVDYLEIAEVEALLGGIDQSTPPGRCRSSRRSREPVHIHLPGITATVLSICTRTMNQPPLSPLSVSIH